MANNTFTLFGISFYNDDYKVRFANDVSRAKHLARVGHEDIRFAEMDSPMTKEEGILLIRDMEDFSDAAAQGAIMEFLGNSAPVKKPRVLNKIDEAITSDNNTVVVDAVVNDELVTEDDNEPF